MQDIGQSAGKSFAYLLGAYLGDGCVTKMSNGRYEVFKLNTIDVDFANAVEAALIECGAPSVSVSKHEVKTSKNPNHSLQCRCEAITKQLVSLTSAKQSLPDMAEWSRDEKIAFVVGLMDSEGFVAANSNTTNRRFYMGFKSCDVWVPDFVRLLQELGIRVGKIAQEVPRKAGYKVPTRFAIKMQSWIDSGARFNIARKQNRVDEWASAGAYECRKPRRLASETTRLAAE